MTSRPMLTNREFSAITDALIPRSFESAMSTLILAIGHIEQTGPRTSDDIARLRLAVSRLDTATSRAARAVQLGEER